MNQVVLYAQISHNIISPCFTAWLPDQPKAFSVQLTKKKLKNCEIGAGGQERLRALEEYDGRIEGPSNLDSALPRLPDLFSLTERTHRIASLAVMGDRKRR
jgi:hypothetical protein